MKINHVLQILLGLIIIIVISCNKAKYYDGDIDPVKTKGYKNENYYSSEKMDSLAVISHINQQKLQEVYDLAILTSEYKSNKDIDTLLLSQLQGYFPSGDTLYYSRIIHNLDSLRAKYVKIELDNFVSNDSLNIIHKDSLQINKSDSIIGKVLFNANFYDKNKRYIYTEKNQANYILKKNPKKFKLEFKFYFSYIGKPE
ncbi:hypothetical protein ETU08_03805 [Apibacter muscae]|uniref:Uncharacterized protein n=1 Tax=Apibacter muscae TaxID=2509004 RepID=A0A563DGR9_9FLAO|nr:hypothetical protein [Apibacter muscae]TWP24927.1 hypothetical protein ETU10_02915 [Apibacter muscae]TWP29327.1 hypothetical protein ETU09_03665 [Apibacter muscae]TWP31141.1 hypothetical protein ETU08_03805 [Apibacter muscae]